MLSLSFLIYLAPHHIFFFFFNYTATTEIYTLSLHDALPIFPHSPKYAWRLLNRASTSGVWKDRKSTRLNSSHDQISYAVFCLKNKKKTKHGQENKKKKKKQKKKKKEKKEK